MADKKFAKLDVAKALAERSGLSVSKCRKLVDHFLQVLSARLAESDDPVVLTGFGTFRVTHRKAGSYIVPATGEKKHREAMRHVAFRPGTDLKSRMNEEI